MEDKRDGEAFAPGKSLTAEAVGGPAESEDNDEGLFNEQLLNIEANEPDFLRGLQDIEPDILRKKLTVLQTFGDGPNHNATINAR